MMKQYLTFSMLAVTGLLVLPWQVAIAQDVTPPTITIDSTRFAECRNPSVSVWLNPTVTDNTDPLPSASFTNRIAGDAVGFPSNKDPDLYPFGSRVVTIRACDRVKPTPNCRNRSITLNVRDTLPPTISVPSTNIKECVSNGGAVYDPQTCEDKCEAQCHPTAVCRAPNTINSSGCTTCKGSCRNACKSDGFLHIDRPSVTDFCDVTPTWYADGVPDFFPLGNTSIDYYAYDRTGNTLRRTVRVQVTDTTGPLFVGSPTNFSVLSQSTNPLLRCVPDSGGFGTIVLLPQLAANDTCSSDSDITYSWSGTQGATQVLNLTNVNRVCLPDGDTLIRFIARDKFGNTDTTGVGRTATTATITIAPSFAIDVQGTQVPAKPYMNVASVVSATATGFTATQLAWSLVGARNPNSLVVTPEGQLTATYTDEGSYCPLYVSASDSTNKGAIDVLPCFAIDTNPPSHQYSGIPNAGSWPGGVVPVFTQGQYLPLEFTAQDSNGLIRSGIDTIQVRIQGSSFDQVVYDNSYATNSNVPGQLPSYLPTRYVSGCNIIDNTTACRCTSKDPQGNCTSDARLDIGKLAPGSYNLVIAVTDAAGNVVTDPNQAFYPFTVANFQQSLQGDPNIMFGGLNAMLTALLTSPDLPASAVSSVRQARDYSTAAAAIFINSPGQAFVLSALAYRSLDTARSNGASTDFYMNYIVDIVLAESELISRKTQQRVANGEMPAWSLLAADAGAGGATVRELYKRRAFLTTRTGNPVAANPNTPDPNAFRDYRIDPNQVLKLATNQMARAEQFRRRGDGGSALQAAQASFDALAALFRDDTFSAIYNYTTNQVVRGDLPPSPEAYFRGSSAGRFGDEIGKTVSAQISRFNTLAQGGVLKGISPGAIATLALAKDDMDALSAAVSIVKNSDWNLAASGFSNKKLVEDIYLRAISALEKFDSLASSSIYTQYWRTGVVMTLASVANFSMYEGPTSLICILWGRNTDDWISIGNPDKFASPAVWNGCGLASARADNAPAIYNHFGGVPPGGTIDFTAQVAECRYNKMMYALSDTRMLGANGAIEQFKGTKCNIIALYNTYYGTGRYLPGVDTPIDPNDYGCPTTPATLTFTDAVASCGACAVVGAPSVPTTDTTCDGVDDNCNGAIDDVVSTTSCGCDGLPANECPCAASSACINGFALACVQGVPASSLDALCNGKDNDCNGVVGDAYLPNSCGVGGCISYSTCSNGSEVACTPKPPTLELCNKLDDNCNVSVDEGLDTDGDGYGCDPNAFGCSQCTPGGGCDGSLLCELDKDGLGNWTGAWDCDDTDISIFPGAVEVCDGKDNNCNGVIDEGVTNSCGNCEGSCIANLTGVNGTPFTPSTTNSTNVTLNPNTNLLELDTQSINTQFAWVANDGSGTVSKIDTVNGREVGRYCQALKQGYLAAQMNNGRDPTGATFDTRSDPRVCGICSGCNRGSRTAVDTSGNVFVGNRAFGAMGNYTKIMSLPRDCVDVNGNGTIETSRDVNGDGVINPNQGLPAATREFWGELDECIAWTRVGDVFDDTVQPSCNNPNFPTETASPAADSALCTTDPNGPRNALGTGGSGFCAFTSSCVNKPSTPAPVCNTVPADNPLINAASDRAACIGQDPQGFGCTFATSCGGTWTSTCAALGAPTIPFAAATSANCLAAGCNWNATTRACSGTTACNNRNNDENGCKFRTGCTWAQACNVNACSGSNNNKLQCNTRNNCQWFQDCYNIMAVPDRLPRAVAIDARGDVWIGMFNQTGFLRVNPINGLAKSFHPASVAPYGAAIDKSGILWAPNGCCGNATLASINTNPNNVDYRDANNVLRNSWTPYQNRTHGNTAAAGGGGSYGIAVDGKNRVWLASWENNNILANRYDAVNNAWKSVPSPKDGNALALDGVGNLLQSAGASRGVTVDASGVVWATQHRGWGTNGRLTGFQSDEISPSGNIFRIVQDVLLTPTGGVPIGVGVGAGGRIWTINQSTSNVSVVDPTTGNFANFPVGGSPYTYSDFTGNILRTFTAPVGSYSEIVDACYGFQVKDWFTLQWDGVTPVGTKNGGAATDMTKLQFRVRLANELTTQGAGGASVDPIAASNWSLWYPDDVTDPNKNATDPNRVYYYDLFPSGQEPTTGLCKNVQTRVFNALSNSFTVHGCADLTDLPKQSIWPPSVTLQDVKYVHVEMVLRSDGDSIKQPTLSGYKLSRSCPQL